MALDLMEGFRPVVDSVVTGLVLDGRVDPAGCGHPTGEKGYRMSSETLEVFLASYEERMLTLARRPGSGRRVSYRAALTAQAGCRPGFRRNVGPLP